MAESAVKKINSALPQQESSSKTRHLRALDLKNSSRIKLQPMPVVLISLICLGFIIAHLCLATLNTKNAYELSGLRMQEHEMKRASAVLNEETLVLSSPQNIVDNAKSLGMMENSNVGSLRLSNGALSVETARRPAVSVNNSVPNINLDGVAILRPDGTTISRPFHETAVGPTNGAEILLTWGGDLPVVQTR